MKIAKSGHNAFVQSRTNVSLITRRYLQVMYANIIITATSGRGKNKQPQKMNSMRILRLTLKKKWFDMILSGLKKEEYRRFKPHWERRLYHVFYPAIMQFREYDAVEFRNGYSADAPTILIECEEITGGIGNPDWGAPDYPVFIIKLGDIIETKNLKAA